MTPRERASGRHRWLIAGALVPAVALSGLLAWGEATGWPVMQAPLTRLLSAQLERGVSFAARPPAPGASAANATGSPRIPAFELRLLGGIGLRVAHLEIAPPIWSTAPHLLFAQDVALELHYIDLWRAWRGGRWRVHSLKAQRVSAHLERLADGRRSWAADDTQPMRASPPLFGRLRVGQARVQVRDATRDVVLQVQASVIGTAAATVLRAEATGRYGRHAVKADLSATGESRAAVGGAQQQQAALVNLKASVGHARLVFDGRVSDGPSEPGISGLFALDGPSLAALGDPLGLTLPTTAAFRSSGRLVHSGTRWSVVVEDAAIGLSRLDGAIVYRADTAVPLLEGRLGGTRLALVDLGPALGVVPVAAVARASHKRLPDRPFDLASLSRMDANVVVDVVEVDLNRRWLEPLRGLQAHLTLNNGVLRLAQLQAALAQGRLAGDMALDGRAAPAQWRTELRWSAVRLEHWVHPVRRSASALPYASGQLHGTATLAGQGISTAEILGSLRGRVRMDLRAGTVSHLLVEAAGLDLAQGLGVWAKGDDALRVNCAVADLAAVQGVLRPRLVVLDTSDSVLWLTGSLSLASEALDLSVHVAPKDFSPLALRTPLRLRGSFAEPALALKKDALARKAGAALLLALINPAAALIPFIDAGDIAAAQQGSADCNAARGQGPIASRRP